MELKAEERKGTAKRLRREGMIPAIIYAEKGASKEIALSTRDFETALRQIPKGRLSTTIFTLKQAGGDVQVVVKDIQYHVTTYNVLHLDLQELKSDVPLNVNVPLRLAGGDDSPGVKLGGVVRPVIRTLRVNCLPKAIPSEFVLDISDLNLGGTKRLSDIPLPEGIRPLAKMDEVAVVIAKR